MTALAQVRRFARRLDAATPPHRDRAVDALRALAIAGVIGGHWLVTALVLGHSTSAGSGGAVLSDNSPLASMPWLAPVSWIFQTLAVFFLVGGYSAARGYRGQGKAEYLPWLRKRMIRLARPVAALAAVWVPVTAGLLLAGVPATTVHTLLFLVISPLWFLGVYAVLTALTPAALGLVRRFGAWAAAFPAGVVAVTDLVRFGLHGPGWVGWVNVAAGWLVPYLLGVAWAQGWLAQGSLRGRRVPALMLAGGAAATAALIAWAGYPASMVGVNGARISNLNPPTLAAVAFGVAQCGLALLLRDRLARLMRRPLAWAAIAHGQPVGDDPVPVAPDRVRHGQFRRPAGRPGAGPADFPGWRPVGGRTAGLAAGVRDRAVGPVAGVPPDGAVISRNRPRGFARLTHRPWRHRLGRRCGMNVMVRMCAVSAAVIAALAGCGSQVQIGAGHPTPTHRACPEGSAYPPGTAGEVDYTDTIWHDSVSYDYFPSVRTTTSQIGSVVTRIQCSMATYPDTHAPPSRLADNTATALSAGTPVHAVKGFSPRCRLAAYVAGHPRTYVAVNNTQHGPVPRACAKVAG